MNRTCFALLAVTLISVVLPSSVDAAPIGYSGSLQAFASAGETTQASDIFDFGSFLNPVPSFESTTVLNFAGRAGSSHATAIVRANGGSIGAAVTLFANENLSSPPGFQNAAQSSVSLGITYHDHWRVDAAGVAPGTLVEFLAAMPPKYTSTGGQNGVVEPLEAQCDGDGPGFNYIYNEVNSLGQSVPSTLRLNVDSFTQIGTEVFRGQCSDATFLVLVPANVDVPVTMTYRLHALASSWDPAGPGNGPITGLGLIFNDLNSFKLFVKPTGPGYSLFTESGNSFAFPSSTPDDPTDPAPVPEPVTLSLLGLGLAGVVVRRFRKCN